MITKLFWKWGAKKAKKNPRVGQAYLSICLPESLKEAVWAAAKANQRLPSAWARSVLEKAVNEALKAPEVAP